MVGKNLTLCFDCQFGVFNWPQASWHLMISEAVVSGIESLHERLKRLEGHMMRGRALGTYKGEKYSTINVFNGDSGPQGNMTGVHVEFQKPDPRDPNYSTLYFTFMLFIPGNGLKEKEIELFIETNVSSIIKAAGDSLPPKEEDQKNKIKQFETRDKHFDFNYSCKFNLYESNESEVTTPGGTKFEKVTLPGIVIGNAYSLDQG